MCFPSISLQEFRDSVLWHTQMSVLCYTAHAKASEQSCNEPINICGREKYHRSHNKDTLVSAGRVKAISFLSELINLQRILPQCCSMFLVHDTFLQNSIHGLEF